MKTVEERLAELEARVAELEGKPHRAQTPLTRLTSRPPDPPQLKEPFRWESLIGSGEGLLGRAGVGLLVVGLILLFRYAVEQGWLTPALRIVIGLVVGLGLLAGGFFRFTQRRLYRQILMGGGIVVLFITGLAATELYHFINASAAFAFFVFVAGLGFMIAAQQDEPIIASIASIGAILPAAWMIDYGHHTASFWLYIAAVAGSAGTLSSLRGWERPLALTGLSASVALMQTIPPGNAKYAAMLAFVAVWIACAALPLIRKPSLAKPLLVALPLIVTLTLANSIDFYIHRNWHLLAVACGLAALAFTAISTRNNREEALFAAIGAGTIATSSLVSEPAWPLAFALFALIAIYLDAHGNILRNLAHALIGIAMMAFLVNLDQIQRRGPFDGYAVTFIAITFVIIAIAFKLPRREERYAYFALAFVLVHTLLATELSDVTQARWLASASWAVVGSSLLISGRKWPGLISLALLIGRLFLYDLTNVGVGVRIVLFMACGFGFLALSYFTNRKLST